MCMRPCESFRSGKIQKNNDISSVGGGGAGNSYRQNGFHSPKAGISNSSRILLILLNIYRPSK